MPFSIRLVAPVLAASTFLTLTPRARAAADVLSPEEQAVAQLELRAAQASVRDQCFLYTELVHTMTELAGRQMMAGDSDRANLTLKRVSHYADLIQVGLSNDTKRLKNTEMLMQQTTYRMSGFLRATSGADRANLQAVLKQLNHVEDQLMTQVFKH